MLVSVSDLVTYMDISLSLRQQDAAELVLSGLQSELEAFLHRPVEVSEFVEEHVIPQYAQGVPASSFFYDESQDTTAKTLSFIQPSITLSLRNTPVVKVTKVHVKSLSNEGINFSEAIKRVADITNATYSSSTITYTAANHGFTVGQVVTVSGLLPSGYNISAKEIISVTQNTFTVGKITTALGSATDTVGTANAVGSDYTVRRYGLELYRGFPNDIIEVTYTGGLDGEAISMFKLMILRAATREMQNMHDDVVGVKDLNPRGVAPLDTGFTDKELLSLRRWRRRRIS